MITLLKAYIDIVALRKGPEDIPASWLVLGISLLLLAMAWVVQISLLNLRAAAAVPVVVAYTAGLFLYVSVARFAGFGRRILPMLSALIACGSLLAMFSVAAGVLILPLLGDAVANAIGILIFFWSVPVKGHIVARTLDKHWFIGIAIAVIEFVLRFTIETSLLASQQGGGA